MIYPNKPLYLLSLLGYIYYLTYYTLTTKDNILHFSFVYHFTPFSFTDTYFCALYILSLYPIFHILSIALKIC